MEASSYILSTDDSSEEEEEEEALIRKASVKGRSRSASNTGSLVVKQGPSTSHHVSSHHQAISSQHPHQPKARRKFSTRKNLTKYASIKEGYLQKQGKSFQRWRRRYFKLKGRHLYYANDPDSLIFHEVDVSDASVAECGPGNRHTFQLITPWVNFELCADQRKDLEEWIAALRSVSGNEFYQCGEEHLRSVTDNEHSWFVTHHSRPTYCNACRETLSGMTWNGLSCEVCKMKAHKKCAVRVKDKCKWTTMESIPLEQRITEPNGVSLSHIVVSLKEKQAENIS